MVEILDAPPCARFVLRCDPREAPLAGAAFGIALPLARGQTVEAGPRAALWLGPDEWLLLAEPGADLAAVPNLAAIAHSLVDLSDAQVALVLHGPGAARLLSAGCPLDLHGAAFPAGMATRTVLGRVGITLWRRGAQEWRLEVGRSLAVHAREFLAEAARGLPAF